MDRRTLKWMLLILLSITWGSSFILIKKGLLALTATQLGALRVLIAGSLFLMLGFKHFKTYSKTDYLWLTAAGLCGNLFPAFLFAFGQTEVPSGVTGVLDTLIPLFTLLSGLAFFGERLRLVQLLGILIGLAGAWLLIHPRASPEHPISLSHVGLIVLGTLCYGINANLVRSRLAHLKPLSIAIGSLSLPAIPALLVLGFSDLGKLEFNTTTLQSLLAVGLLSVAGTALALLGFYKLIQLSSAVFATSVTYLMPLVAILWAVLDGEAFNVFQLLATLPILLGVYLISKRKNA